MFVRDIAPGALDTETVAYNNMASSRAYSEDMMEKAAHRKFNSSFVCRAVIFAAFFAMAAFNCYAQKLTEGSLNFLKGQEKVKLILDFDDVMLQGKTQKAYLEMESENKEWIEVWETGKSSVFPERLLEHLNKNVKGVQFGDYPDAQYQAIVRVLTVSRSGRGVAPGLGSGQYLEGPGTRVVTCEVVFTKAGDSTPLAKITKLSGNSQLRGPMPTAVAVSRAVGTNNHLTGLAFGYIGQGLGKFVSKKIK